jgi:hypothetical protein
VPVGRAATAGRFASPRIDGGGHRAAIVGAARRMHMSGTMGARAERNRDLDVDQRCRRTCGHHPARRSTC